MAEAIYDSLGAAVTRWTMGGTAAPVAPPAWAPHLGADPGEAELRLLALSGQFLGVLVTAEPSALHALPDVPALAMPAVPEALRPLARRILRATREARVSRDLLRFLAARGYTLHPGDWMPGAGEDDVPDVYAAWHDWAQGQAAPAGRSADADLTEETWPDYWPAARNVAFAALRKNDPAAATALLAAKLAGENADARLRLVAKLATRLSDADRPFLESLATDRAPKVKALAASLLARLGHGSAMGEEAVELVAFFEVQTRGLLRRTRVIVAQALKTEAPRSRRRLLFDAVDLAAFAQGFGATPADLVAIWPWSEDRLADYGLVQMIERSGSDAVVAALCDALGGLGTADVPAMLALLPRLDTAQRRGFALKALQGRDGSFRVALGIAGGDCPLDGALDAPAGLQLLAALKTDETGRRAEITGELHALGLLASRAAAQAAIDRLARAGLLAADPRLDMLRLNAALDDGGTR